MTQHLVVVGGGMVAQRLVEALRDRDAAGTWRITVLAEEPRRPYDRVALTSYFSGRDADDLALGDPALWDDPLVTLVRDDAVVALDRAAKTVTTTRGRTEHYDHLVLATGSSAWVPPLEGADLPGVFVYRTVDDVAALRGYVEKLSQDRVVKGAVLGGGLLGLEAAGALQALGAKTTVLQVGTHLMSAQVDLGGGEALRRLINQLGVGVRLNAMTTKIRPHRRGGVGRLELADGGRVDADVVVIAAGVRPRDELGRASELAIGERGGIVVDDTCLTSDPDISAVGEVASIQGACIGLVAPGYAMAEITADRLLGGVVHVPRRRHGHQAQALGRRRRVLRRRVRHHPRRARDRLGRPGGRRLQEARDVRRRAHAARRRPRRRCLRLREPAPDAGPRAARRPGRVPPARGRRRGSRARASRRRGRVLVQQRLRRDDPRARSPSTTAPTSARSRRAPAPAPPAGRACRW